MQLSVESQFEIDVESRKGKVSKTSLIDSFILPVGRSPMALSYDIYYH